MWWVAFIELGLFLMLTALVAWVFFKPAKKKKNDDKTSHHS